MTITRTEFLRLLPAALGGEPFAWDSLDPSVLVSQSERPRWRIRLAPLPPIHLGPLALERLRVELGLEGYPPGPAAAFVDRFMSHFQRGGG